MSSAAGLSSVSEVISGEPTPVYVLWGDDEGAMDEAVTRFRTWLSEPPLGAPGMESFNHERFDAAYTRAVARVLEACAQLPIAAERRFVEVQQADAFASQVRATGEGEERSSPAEAIEAFIQYFSNPNPTTCLLLICPNSNGNAKLIRAAKSSESVTQIRFEVAKDADAGVALRERAEELGRSLETEVARAIIDAVGPKRSDWSSALDRCIEHAGEGPVRLEDVRAVVSRTRDEDVFELTEAMASRDLSQALALLERQFGANDKDPGVALRLHALLVWQLRRLLVAGHAGNPGQALGAPAFVGDRLREQARRFGKLQLCAALSSLQALDGDLKGGSSVAAHAPKLVLQRWLMAACGGA